MLEPPATPSPFVEGTRAQRAWDSTSLGWLKTCPRLYYYHMIEGWRTRHESVHLQFGIFYHSALEHYDRAKAQGESHEDAVESALLLTLTDTWGPDGPWRAAADLDSADRASLKCREYLVRTVVWYLDKFRDDPAKTMRLADGSPMVELHFQFEINFNYDYHNPYMLCGYLDRVVEFNGEPFVMDRKTTTSTVNSNYFEQYDPDNQMSLYTIASQVAFHTPVKGVIIDAAQIAVGFSRFQRHFVFKTPDQIEEWLHDLKFWLRLNEKFVEADYWPMNDKSCHKYGGCEFRHICSKSPQVRDKFLETTFERRPWNPLELRG